jgi:hypothetical protein
MKTIRKTTNNNGEIVISVDEIFREISAEFPDGFTSAQASYFIKGKYDLRFFSLVNSGIIKYLVEREVITKESLGENQRSRYTLTGNKLPDADILTGKNLFQEIMDGYDNRITPIIEDGSLKKTLLDKLKITLLDNLHPEN